MFLLKIQGFLRKFSIVFDFARVALFILLNAIFIAFNKLKALISVLVCNRGEH